MPESETAADPTEVPVMIAEAKALRGFFYLQLVQRWGGVPIVDKVLDVSDDLRLPRNTMQECLDFIVNDFEEAAEVLGLEPRGGMATWGGRITKGAALAFRARAILWGASQYWSANGVNYTWQQAADACQDVIALNKYSLHQDFRTTLFDPDAFGTEIIFWHNQGYYQGFNFVNLVHTVFGGTTSPGIQLPTYEFVKCYEILDEATGKYVPFDEKNSDHMENLINPDRRDPRFAASVLYNGATHQGKVCGLYTGGNLWSSSIYYTGYQYKRWYSEDQITGGGGSGTTLQNWAFIRYTDILLMYAEAQNQASGMNSSASGATMTALEAYNAVRLRSGLTALEESDFTSDYTFDDRIRNERSVEFPCEDIRFFDIRRWDIGNVAWVTPHGSDATANSDGTYTYDYSREIGTKRTPFANTHQAVLYPFHHTELTRNPNLVQNPGWTDIYRN